MNAFFNEITDLKFTNDQLLFVLGLWKTLRNSTWEGTPGQILDSWKKEYPIIYKLYADIWKLPTSPNYLAIHLNKLIKFGGFEGSIEFVVSNNYRLYRFN